MSHDPLDATTGSGLVWHYTDGPGLLSIVRSHLLWATASGYLNDRDEVSLGFRRLHEELDARVGSGDEFARGLLRRAEEAGADRSGPSPSSFFILSAAKHWDLLAMWRCSGGRGESYAIGLDPAAALRVVCDAGVPALDRDAGRWRRPWTTSSRRWPSSSTRASRTNARCGTARCCSGPRTWARGAVWCATGRRRTAWRPTCGSPGMRGTAPQRWLPRGS